MIFIFSKKKCIGYAYNKINYIDCIVNDSNISNVFNMYNCYFYIIWM